jgi:hypothetical protein
MIAEQADPSAARRWAKAEATAALSGERTCIECRVEFRRLYRDVRGRPRLRSPKEWARSIYCSQSCASAYRSRRRVWLGLHLAGLDAAPPSPERREARPPGRPSRKTGVKAIERAERAATILRMRFGGGYTFKQIGMMQTPPVSPQSVHQRYWRLIKAAAAASAAPSANRQRGVAQPRHRPCYFTAQLSPNSQSQPCQVLPQP